MPKPTTAYLALPDNTTGGVQPAAPVQDGSDWDKAWAIVSSTLNADWFMWALCGLLALLLALSIRTRRKRVRAEKAGHKADLTFTDRAVTVITGVLATATVATGAWKVFGLPALDLHPAFRIMLFFFAEAQIIAAWRRVRRYIYRHAMLGPGIRTIYGIALGSAFVAAFDADVFVEVLLRFFAAGVAAYMIAEELAEELDIYLEKNPELRGDSDKPRQAGRIKWTLNLERVLMWLRLAEASNRTIADVERQRRIAQLSRTAYRLQILKDRDSGAWLLNKRIGWVRWRLRRLTEAANEHLKLATDKVLLAELRAQAALLYGAEDGMSRRAVRDLRPWSPVEQLAIGATPEAPLASPSVTDWVAIDIANRSDTTVANPVATEPATEPAVKVATDGATRVATIPATETATNIATETAIPVAATNATDNANPVATEPANDGATKTAKKPAIRRATKVATEGANDTVIRLAKFLAKYPDETNLELAKRMRCGDRTVSRYRAAAEALNAATERPETRPEHPLVATPITPIPEPRESVTAGVNGHHYPTSTAQENQ